MGVRIGGSIGPAYISASPKDIGKAASTPLTALILATYWIGYGLFLLYKYLFLGMYWAARWLWRQGVAAYHWYQDRRAEQAAATDRVRQRAEEQHRAYLAGDDQGIYGNFPPSAQ